MPKSRTCHDCRIPQQFCVCENIEPIKITKKLNAPSKAIVNKVNELLTPFESCTTLKMNKVSNHI